MNKLSSTKHRVFMSLVGPSETGKRNLFTIGSKKEPFNQNLTTFTFYQHSQTSYDVMQKQIENFEFVQGVNFEYIDSLKNNGTKYLLIFDISCERICNSEAFVDIATAGRHPGLSTIYIEHNLFHQRNLGKTLSSRTRTLFFPSLSVM